MPDPSAEARHVLRIGVIQGMNVIEERLVRTRGPVSFGTAPGNTFVLQDTDLPRSITVFEIRGDKYQLVFGDDAQGQLEKSPGESQKLVELKNNIENSGGRYRIDMEDTFRGRLKLSPEITMLFHFVPAPPTTTADDLPSGFKGGLRGDIEPIFTAVLLASFLLHSAAAVVIHIAEPPQPPELEELRKIVENITPPRLAAPKVPIEVDTPLPLRKGRTGHQLKPAADRVGNGELKSGGSRGVEDRAAVRDAIAGKGILQLIGARSGGGGDGDGGAVGSVFGAGGTISDDIGKALAGTAGGGIAGTSGGVTRRSEGGEGRGGAAGIGDVVASGGGVLDTGEKHATRVVARVRAEDVETVDGTVDKKGVAATIRRRQDAFQSCYENALKASSTLQGKIIVEFTIGDGGKVTDARVVRDDLNSAEVSMCVLATMKRIRFPAPADGEVTISNSFVFQPGG